MKVLRPLSAALLVLSLSAGTALAQPPSFSQNPFTDVPTNHRSFVAIEYLRTNNVLRGYLDGTFKPNQTMTRAEFVQLLTDPFFLSAQNTNDCVDSTAGTTPKTKTFFTDVKGDDWFATAVCVAKLRGIVNGYPDGMFHPNDTISFVEAAKIAANVFALSVRKDTPSDAKWFTAYIQRLDELKAIPSTIKKLTQPVTRAEMAEIVFRLKTNDMTRPTTRWNALTQ